MSALLTVEDADFSASAIAFVPPILEGLEYWNYFGDISNTGRNLVVGKPAGSVIGSPVLAAKFTTFSAFNNYVPTGLLDQSLVTLLGVARPNTPSQSPFKYVIGSVWAALQLMRTDRTPCSTKPQTVDPEFIRLGRTARTTPRRRWCRRRAWSGDLHEGELRGFKPCLLRVGGKSLVEIVEAI
jgi:hypothetical protein